MNIAKIMLVPILLVSIASTTASTSTPPAPTCHFPAMYNFGDSNSDTGGISAAFWPTPPPNGVTYFRKPAGRNSDGRLIIDFIAQHLGLPFLSSYLDSIGSNYRYGANFATGGSTIRPQNESIFEHGISPFPLQIQTSQFYQFQTRTTQLYRQARYPFKKSKLPRPEDFSKAIYTIDIGQNDLSVGFWMLTTTQLRASIPEIVNQLATAIIGLYQRGARMLWIHNTGPIGCLPAARFYMRSSQPGSFDKYGCIRAHNAMAVQFNRQLKARVVKLRAELPHSAIVYVDIYSAKYHLIRNAKQYGFKDQMSICCGHHKGSVHVWCGQRQMINGSEIVGAMSGSPATCLSWDGVHYSETANKWIANHILNGSFSDPPRPIHQACFKH